MLGEACALGAALLWSVSVILFKRSEAVTPLGLNLHKNVTAALLLLLTLPLMGQGIDWQRPAADWWRLVLSGLFGIALADTMVFMALRRLGASLLAVVNCVYAPSIVLLGVLMLGERPGIGFAVGAVLVVGGVVWAATERARTTVERPAAAGRLGGVLLGAGGIVAMGFGVVLAKPVLERGALVEVTLVRLLVGVAGQLVWIALAPSQRSALRALVPSAAWRTLLPASVLGSYLAMLLWLGGFKHTTASTASVLNQMSSVFTIVLARVLLGEQVGWRRALGAGAAVGGALMVLLLR